MKPNLKNEKWKQIQFDFKFNNDTKVEVSDQGRIRTFNRISDGSIIKAPIINGYAVLRLKFFSARKKATVAIINSAQLKVTAQQAKINALKEKKASKQLLKDANTLLAKLKADLKLIYNADLAERTIPYNALVHRLVATYFVKKSSEKQTVVAHLDHNKLNNVSSNLKWMSLAENFAHQQKSPLVIAEKKNRKDRVSPNVSKLKENQVIAIKKLLLQKKTIASIALKYNISETQIIRIKTGENWSNIKIPK